MPTRALGGEIDRRPRAPHLSGEPGDHDASRLHLPTSSDRFALLLRLPIIRLASLVSINSVIVSRTNSNKVKKRFSALKLSATANEFIALIAELGWKDPEAARRLKVSAPFVN